jgi:enamine deaminase RidA (YjgF/YER057c/UK114 family)
VAARRGRCSLPSTACSPRRGSDKSRLLTAQIFLADMADFAAMNAVWDGWVVAGQTPARATVQAAMAGPAYKVEIVVTAATH